MMATRAQIVFTWHWSYEETVKWLDSHAVAMIYKDNSGDLVESDLVEFMKTKPFFDRSNDPVYLSAICLHYLTTLDADKLDNQEWIGLGISNEIHGDIQYLYWFDTVWEQLRVYEHNLENFELTLLKVYKFEDMEF